MDLYDSQHPFFVEQSPFYLNPTDDEVLEVSSSSLDMAQEEDWQKINLLELSWFPLPIFITKIFTFSNYHQN